MITRRLHSWQAHLKRLSPYLILGEGVWWHSTISGYEIHDGKEAPEFQNQGPQLLHFRHTGFKDLEQKKEVAWQNILDQNIPLPKLQLRIYNDIGDFIGYRLFHSDDTTDPEPMEIDEPLDTHEEETNSDENALNAENNTNEETIAVEIDDTQEHTSEDPSTSETTTPLELSDKENAIPTQTLYKMKLANNLYRALGNSVTEFELDASHYSIKLKRKKPSQEAITQYKQLLATMQSHLIDRTKLKQALKTYENNYFLKQQALPDEQTHRVYNQLLNNTCFISKLLDSWHKL